jgi:LysM repeat protein
MNRMVRLFRVLPAVLLLLSTNGCIPDGRSELDEEKEPHFLAGKKAINAMDYRGAIEQFEKALEANPRNSKAHSQLGWLYEEKESDAAAAIYHYERSLKLRPGSDNAEVVRQRIMNCKQDLAKSVFPLPITPRMQRQFEQVIEENKRLKEENEKWKAYFARVQPATSAPTATPVQPRVSDRPAPAPTHTNQQPSANGFERTVPVQGRTHVVQRGETPFSIARRHGVTLNALLSANPMLDPRRMRIGQVVNIPPSQ